MSGISVCGRNPITYSNESYFSVVLLITEAPVVLFIVLCKVVLTFESLNEILWCDHSNESYSEQYFPVVVFIILYKVILTFESVDENLWCGHLNTSY